MKEILLGPRAEDRRRRTEDGKSENHDNRVQVTRQTGYQELSGLEN